MTTVLVLGLLVGWFWWQQNGLSSETITVSSAPDGFDGYRIAVVSDLHAKEFGEGNRVLLDYVRDLEPDLVAVVGDILHEPDQMSMIPAVAKGLAAIAPTYYVTGNHEWAARGGPGAGAAAGAVRGDGPVQRVCHAGTERGPDRPAGGGGQQRLRRPKDGAGAGGPGPAGAGGGL